MVLADTIQGRDLLSDTAVRLAGLACQEGAMEAQRRWRRANHGARGAGRR